MATSYCALLLFFPFIDPFDLASRFVRPRACQPTTQSNSKMWSFARCKSETEKKRKKRNYNKLELVGRYDNASRARARTTECALCVRDFYSLIFIFALSARFSHGGDTKTKQIYHAVCSLPAEPRVMGHDCDANTTFARPSKSKRRHSLTLKA